MAPTMYYTTAFKDMQLYMTAEKVMVSIASCLRARRDGTMHFLTTWLPDCVTELAADCGGYAAAMRWGGRYPFTVRQYVHWLSRWPLQPTWAAMLDLPCVAPGKGRKDPGPDVVRARQRFTTQTARAMWAEYRLAPWSWCPTIQGFYPEQYAEHAREMRDLIAEMYAASLETACFKEDDDPSAFRIGIGSLCGASPALVREIVRQVQSVLGVWIPLHLWGFKLQGFQAGDELIGVLSCDTGAFNDRFNEQARERQRESGKPQGRYLWENAQPGYAERLKEAQSRPVQPTLFPIEYPHDPTPIFAPDEEDINTRC